MEDKTAEITPRSSVEDQPEKPHYKTIPKPKQGERMGAETWAGFKRIGRRAGCVTLRSSVTGKVLTLAEDSAAYQGWCQWHGKSTPAEEKAQAEQEAKTDVDIMVEDLKEHIRETRIDRQAVIERHKEEKAAEEPKGVCEVCFADEYPEGQILVCEECGVPFGPCCNSETDGLCVDCV